MRPRLALVGVLLSGLAIAGCGGSPTEGAADGPQSSSKAGGGASSSAPASASGSAADSSAYAQYTSLTGKDRTDKLLADAKAAGGVVDIYTSNTDIQDLVDAFQKAYPDIKVNAFRANSETVLQRITQESQAGKPQNDVVDTNDAELRALNAQGLLTDYQGPALDNLRDAAKGFKGWVAERFNAFVVGWNTDKVKEGDIPKKFQDLADPKYSGKLSLEVGDWDWYASMHTYLTDEQHMSDDEVDALFKKIVSNAKVVKGHTVQGELLGAGQFAFALSVYSHTIDKAAKKGAPVAWKPAVQPVILRPNGFALMAKPRHPAAALLWADWVLTDGQKVIADSKRIPAAKNVEGFDNPLSDDVTVYNVPETAIKDSQKWSDEYDSLLRGLTKVGG
ncbi:MAG: ABC transporter substrate-binding protein [Actinomycetales bacterium]